MITRQIDELSLHAIVIEVKRYSSVTKPKVGLRMPNQLKPSRILQYKKVSSFGQNILCRIRDNIQCGVYTLTDFWNYLILIGANGNSISIEKLPTGHEEICSIASMMTNARFDIDGASFKKAHSRFVKDGVVVKDGDIMKTYYDCFSGSSSMMYRMTQSGAVSPRFYKSGYLRYLEKGASTTSSVGVVEAQWRKMVIHLQY